MGTADLSDGDWLWPEGLHVYVSQFHVRLPGEFVGHMRARAFAVPEHLSKESFGAHKVDFSYWTRWAAEQL
jgi:hypothetical protein